MTPTPDPAEPAVPPVPGTDTDTDTDDGATGLEVTVVLPCLNESETVATCVRKARSCLDHLGVCGEVVVADNGSTDGSQELAARAGARVVAIPHRGYGAALMGGIEAARGRHVIMADADDSYDLEGLGPFIEELRDGADLVMGNRFAGGIEPGAMPALHRWVGNPALSFIGRLLFRTHIGDFHCGMRGFRRQAIIDLDLRTTGMEFASEMVVRASLAGLDVREVPTTLRPDGRTRKPHLRTWRDGWRHLRFLLLYSPRWLFLIPGLVMMAVGLVGTLWLLPGPRTIGDVGFDIHALLYALTAIMVGAQAVFFAIFARMYVTVTGLLPPSTGLDRLLKVARLEVGLWIGLTLIVGGIIGSVVAVNRWGETSFGGLDASDTMRVVAPSVTAVSLGVEVILASFMLSVLTLDRR